MRCRPLASQVTTVDHPSVADGALGGRSTVTDVLMVAFRCLWLHLGAYGCIQVHMVAFRRIWLRSGVYGCIQVVMVAFRCIWLHSGAYGCIQIAADLPRRDSDRVGAAGRDRWNGRSGSVQEGNVVTRPAAADRDPPVIAAYRAAAIAGTVQ
ncbi:hypothetical protein Taro_037424, partial [Colocasia esculenta]|nr:hypothetical protein [Colocasia esculenta]